MGVWGQTNTLAVWRATVEVPFFQAHFFDLPRYAGGHGLHYSGQNPLSPADDPWSALGARGFCPGPRGGGALPLFIRRLPMSGIAIRRKKSGAKAHTSQTAPIDG